MALSKILPASQEQYAGARNLIINGNCVIDQRNNGSSVSGTGVFPVDRWKHFESQSSKFTSIQRSTDAPPNFINSVEYTSASSYSVLANDYFTHEQAIEGYTAAHLGWGTANAKDVTLSFWVKSSLTGTFGGALYSGTGSYGYPFSYTISSANTWEQKSISITAPTSGTFTTDNSKSFNVCFSLGVGSDYKFAAGSWQSQVVRSATGETSLVGTSGATWYITGVQLEVGEATPFEHRSYGDELARCQRYYYKSNSGYHILTKNGYFESQSFYFPTTMRANATITYGTAPVLTGYQSSSSISYSGLSLQGRTDRFFISSSTTNNSTYYNWVFNTAIRADAEL